MRKNIQLVIEAYKQHKSYNAELSKQTNVPVCSTDGESIYSYRLKIAWRLPGGITFVIPEAGYSKTTTMQIRSVAQIFGRSCGHEECEQHKEMAALCPLNQKLLKT